LLHSFSAIVIPIYKKGDLKDCENYRGTSLLNSGYKIFPNISKNKLSRYYESILGEEQNGFRKGRSYSDGYFTMKVLLERHRKFNMKTHVAFVDLKKAFDRVNRTKLPEILQNENIPQQIIQNIYNLYKTNFISVKIEDRKSEWKVIDKAADFHQYSS
jgi:hypothetical protein